MLGAQKNLRIYCIPGVGWLREYVVGCTRTVHGNVHLVQQTNVHQNKSSDIGEPFELDGEKVWRVPLPYSMRHYGGTHIETGKVETLPEAIRSALELSAFSRKSGPKFVRR